MTPALALIVLYVADLESSRRFYTALGLTMTEEQHGSGPVHFSAMLGGTVLELYPAGGGPVTRTRLALRVHDPDAAAEAVRAAGFEARVDAAVAPGDCLVQLLPLEDER